MSYWAVARIAAQREEFVIERLEAYGFREFFAPKTRSRGGREVSLFPGYLFVRIVESWRAIDRTLGVLSLIKFGDAPAKCPDGEIAKIRSQIDADGLVRLPGPPKSLRRIGAKVMIAAGPFSGRVAIYAGMTAREREMVLINLLGRQAIVKLRPGQLTSAAELANLADSALSQAHRAGFDEERQRPMTVPRRAEPFGR